MPSFSLVIAVNVDHVFNLSLFRYVKNVCRHLMNVLAQMYLVRFTQTLSTLLMAVRITIKYAL